MSSDAPSRRQRVRRPVISCTLCRRRKIKCDRETPCSNCRRSRKGVCTYDAFPLPVTESHSAAARTLSAAVSSPSYTDTSLAKDRHLSSSASVVSDIVPTCMATLTGRLNADTSLSKSASFCSVEISRLKDRLRQLECQSLDGGLGRQDERGSSIVVDTTSTSSLVGTFHVFCEGEPGQSSTIPRSFAQKTRIYGQSYFAVGMILLIRGVFEKVEARLRSDDEARALTVAGIQHCKSLATDIKTLRAPPWPCPVTHDLPARHVADALVESYLRSTESIYRIVHVPSFRRDYEALWQNPEPDMGFMVQVKLVLAIGAVTFDDHFSLRVEATRWIWEAQTWTGEPRFKSRLVLQSIQTHILLMIAQDRVGTGGDPMWITSGALLRKAMHMGLHRDPSQLPQHTTLAAEMRRRVWNTLLELNLQSSIDIGGAPLLSLHDFDTAGPANLDDEQLTIDQRPIPRPNNEFTETTVAILLRQTLPQRLAIAVSLNGMSKVGGYEEILRLDRNLRTASKDMMRSMRAAVVVQEDKPEFRMVHFIIQRHIIALHAPYFAAALHDARYAYSRTSVVDASMKIWTLFGTPTLQSAGRGLEQDPSADHRMLGRLSRCGADMYPSVTLHAAFHLLIELRTQLELDTGLELMVLRPDLVNVLEDVRPWTIAVAEAGETNVRGAQVTELVAAQIRGLQQGLNEDEIIDGIVKSTQEMTVVYGPILEKHLTELKQSHLALTGGNGSSTDHPSNAIQDDWNLLTFDPAYDLAHHDPLGWMFNGDDQMDMGAMW